MGQVWFRFTKANGQGGCRICGKQIKKNCDQLVIDYGRGSNSGSARVHDTCLFKLHPNFTINYLQARKNHLEKGKKSDG
jgi:hypothetical protein